MKKYKLINTKTDEEYLCDKVTIDGFDYYVSDKGYFKHNDLNVPSDFSKVSDISITKIHDLDIVNDSRNGYKKVIATNNPNIDISKVVDNVKMLATQQWGDVHRTGILGFKIGYNKSQETYSFSEEDMIEFAEFVAKYSDKNKNYKGEMLYAQSKYDGAERTIDLLQLWKEQRTKTIYYDK